MEAANIGGYLATSRYVKYWFPTPIHDRLIRIMEMVQASILAATKKVIEAR